MSILARQLAPSEVGPSAAGDVGHGALEWTFNPWRERPWMALLAASICVASVLFLLSLGLRPVIAIVLGIAMGGALGPLMIPARCRVDDDGVAYRRLLAWERRPWTRIGRAKRVRGGLLVSPFRQPQPLDTFRALLLPMPRGERDALHEQLRERLAAHDL